MLRTRVGAEWALQGSNHLQSEGAESVPQDTDLQETVYRLVQMLLSGIAPDRVAMVLRVLAHALESEAASGAPGAKANRAG